MGKRFALLLTVLLAACSSTPHAADFTLTSDRGTPWTLSAQSGKIVALFFGYTHCTDTCPATLAKLAKAMEASHAAGEIAFVTIDPARDTPSVMRAYLRRFPEAPIVGLTGTPVQIDAVEHAYHVFAERGPAGHDRSGYDEVHSAFTFLIDRSGRQRFVLEDDDSLAAFTSDLRRLRS